MKIKTKCNCTQNWDELDTNELLEHLYQGNSSAWNYVCLELIAPLTRQRKYVEMARDLSMELDSLVTQTYMYITKNNYEKLRKYCGDGKFQAWLYFQIKDALKLELKELRGKLQNVVSENETGTPLCKYTEPAECTHENKLHEAEACVWLEELWQQSPMKTFVLLLRAQNGLAADDVSEILGINKANVDQLFSRAKKIMREKRNDAI